ncbi:pilus assembly protein [Bradyrhizobium sp. CB82]|uniref:TadE/TadG family type IV pilus assembly protein n=1 Tax=Bradyrhizobium sp. CB82 TaxID=3039159 RepID=UPI0024B059B9|nr:TadE/TadG family type IV pilus assembly protein [Bradyrhizobium sp. CB82]WFU41570.1 pilus assembly protein [Bradyrhizobium sp. CB82]
MRNLWVDTRAVAAVEFAIVVPFMLLLYVGGVELGNGLAISVKVSETAHTVADLVSRNACVTDSSLSTMLGASAATIAPYSSPPYSSTNVTVIVSEVSTDAKGNATVTWSKALNGTPLTGAVTLPASLGTPSPANVSLILGQVTYQYTPNLGYTIAGTINISESYYLYPRVSSAVQYPCS